jgi:hypothetical protein
MNGGCDLAADCRAPRWLDDKLGRGKKAAGHREIG